MTTTTTTDERVAEAAMLEYGKLKDEQAQRIGARDNLTYATLTAVAATQAGWQWPSAFTAIPDVKSK